MASTPGDVDLAESQQPRLYGAYTSTYCLAVTAICLRLYSRKYLSKAGLWWDDYAIGLSGAFATANFIDMLIWVRRGVGTHIARYGQEGVKHFFIGLFVCEIFYTLVLCFTKFSILLFYWRIFGKSNIQIPAAVLGSVVTGWGIAVVVTTIFQCDPVRGFWDHTVPASCRVNVYAFFIGNAVPNIITDWALLILPIPFVWRLQKSRVQKIALCGIFLLGGFICIISIVRLCIMTTQLFGTASTDYTWLFIDSSTWTAVETNIGIVSGLFLPLAPPIPLPSVSSSPSLKPQPSSSVPPFAPPRAHGLPGQEVESEPAARLFERDGGQL